MDKRDSPVISSELAILAGLLASQSMMGDVHYLPGLLSDFLLNSLPRLISRFLLSFEYLLKISITKRGDTDGPKATE